MDYYIGRTVAEGFDDTVTRVVEALKKEGFGVLTDIDVADIETEAWDRFSQVSQVSHPRGL